MSDNKKTADWLKFGAKVALTAVSPSAMLAINLGELLKKGSKQTNDDQAASENESHRKSLERLKVEARVAQEVAIARRIETAEIVEIEEYYESNGKGAAGVQGSEEGITIGASGEGQRVSHRIYRFKGWNSTIAGQVEEIEQRLMEDVTYDNR